LDRLDIACNRSERFIASRELLSQQILGNHRLCDLIWNGSLPLNLPREVTERLSVHFGRVRFWDDDEEWPGIDVVVAGESVISPSAALAHARVTKGQAMACLPLGERWRGPCDVVADGKLAVVHFVSDEASHRVFFRNLMQDVGDDVQSLEGLAPHAFPDLCFVDGVWRGVRSFEGGYNRVKDALHRLLAILDEHGGWVFTDTTGRLSSEEARPPDGGARTVTNQLVERRFTRWGLDIGPEKPNVYLKKECREARERKLGERVLYCQWHNKFDSNINRAHIHEPVPESDGRVVIGIFCDHLPLP
jgi:hypothetical protein